MTVPDGFLTAFLALPKDEQNKMLGQAMDEMRADTSDALVRFGKKWQHEDNCDMDEDGWCSCVRKLVSA